MATRPYTGPSVRPTFPIAGVLGVIFVTLKLAGVGTVATWPWLWVLAPFWIPFAVALALFGVAGLCWLALNGLEAYDRRKEAKANVPAPSTKK